ncbi:MAG: VOC family protein [Bacteriovoracaceae bacterium]
MDITINHTIVYCEDKESSAKWYSEIFGFEFIKVWGIFAVVRVNPSFTLDFKDALGDIFPQHYAFKVNDKQFDEILERLKSHEVKYCSDPFMFNDNNFDFNFNTKFGGRGVYFLDPNGHKLEILTSDYDLDGEFY